MEHCHTVLSFTLVSSVLASVKIVGASESSAVSSLDRLSLNAYELACHFLVTWFSSDSVSVISLSVDALFSVTADLLTDFAALFAATAAFFSAAAAYFSSAAAFFFLNSSSFSFFFCSLKRFLFSFSSFSFCFFSSRSLRRDAHVSLVNTLAPEMQTGFAFGTNYTRYFEMYHNSPPFSVSS